MNRPHKDEPLEARLLPETPANNRGLLLIGCGFVGLIVLCLAAGVVGIISLARQQPVATAATRQESMDEKRQSLRQGFDPAHADPQFKLNHPDRRQVERLLLRMVRASNRDNNKQFLSLVDLGELGDRTLRHPTMPTLSAFGRQEVRDSFLEEETLGNISRLRLFDLQSIDETHLLAYVFLETEGRVTEPLRLWLVKRGNSLQLADWEYVEFGYSVSDRYAIRQAANVDSRYAQERQSDAYLQQSRKLLAEGKRAEAAVQLQLAQQCELPPAIDTLQKYLVMLEWLQIGDKDATIELCRSIPTGERGPGFLLQLANAFDQLGRHEEALQAASEYEQAAGFHPEMVAVRARAHEALDRPEAAYADYLVLHHYAMFEERQFEHLYRLLPADRKDEFLALVKNSANPLQTALAQVDLLHEHNDEDLANQLEQFLASTAPESIELLNFRAQRLSWNDEHELAAALYKQAAEKSEDAAIQDSFWQSYLWSMQLAGKGAEAALVHPDRHAALVYFAGGYEAEEPLLSPAELRPLIDELLAAKHDDLETNRIAGLLAFQAEDWAAAELHFRTAHDQVAEEGYEKEQLAERLLISLARQWGVIEAFEDATEKPSAYHTLADDCIREGKWKTLEELNTTYRQTPAGAEDVWLAYYDAKIALAAEDYPQAASHVLVGKHRLAQQDDPHAKTMLELLDDELVNATFGLEEAYRRSTNKLDKFRELQYLARSTRDWETADKLCELHRRAHPNDPYLLDAQLQVAQARGDHNKVISLLQPWPKATGFQSQYNESNARTQLVRALLHEGRVDEALAAAQQGNSKSDMLALIHLQRGDVDAMTKLAEQEERKAPGFFQSLHYRFTREVAAAFVDDKWTELRRARPVQLRDRISPSIVLLSSQAEVTSREQLEKLLQAALPELEISEPVSHQLGTTYQLNWPGAEAAGAQLTVSSRPYVTDHQLAEVTNSGARVKRLLANQQTWYAFEMLEPEPSSDAVWQQLRDLATTLYDDQVVAIGYQHPAGYQLDFLPSDPHLRELFHSPTAFEAELDSRTAEALPLPDGTQAKISPAVARELRQRGRKWLASHQAAESPAPLQIRVVLQHGHQVEHAWLQVAKLRQTSYGNLEFEAETLEPSPLTRRLIPTGRIQISKYQVLEWRDR
ncbi:hypothetical protein NA78x_001286 [Anatilimnocola sp. NA78]|uniref:hypothetical protein n=1 Tax=Anatilimnocola sp. NA78 TaxID=3415683 RepID=UPI003CE4CCE0